MKRIRYNEPYSYREVLMGENTNMTMEQGPVTFERPLKKKESRKQKEINSIITWFVRGAAFLAEVLFVLPLCVVSCSTQPKGDKTVNGFSASFGFKLSYLEEPVVGIWWFVIVFFLTALIIILWYAKDMNRLKDLKLRKMMLCFLTGVLAVFNVIIICCFNRICFIFKTSLTQILFKLCSCFFNTFF